MSPFVKVWTDELLNRDGLDFKTSPASQHRSQSNL